MCFENIDIHTYTHHIFLSFFQLLATLVPLFQLLSLHLTRSWHCLRFPLNHHSFSLRHPRSEVLMNFSSTPIHLDGGMGRQKLIIHTDFLHINNTQSFMSNVSFLQINMFGNQYKQNNLHNCVRVSTCTEELLGSQK